MSALEKTSASHSVHHIEQNDLKNASSQASSISSRATVGTRRKRAVVGAGAANGDCSGDNNKRRRLSGGKVPAAAAAATESPLISSQHRPRSAPSGDEDSDSDSSAAMAAARAAKRSRCSPTSPSAVAGSGGAAAAAVDANERSPSPAAAAGASGDDGSEVSVPALGGAASVGGCSSSPAGDSGDGSAVASAGVVSKWAGLSSDYHSMPRMWRTVPVASRPFFLPLARRECIAFRAAYTKRDQEAMQSALQRFMGLIRLSLRRPRGGKQNSNKGAVSALNRRLTALMAGEDDGVVSPVSPRAAVVGAGDGGAAAVDIDAVSSGESSAAASADSQLSRDAALAASTTEYLRRVEEDSAVDVRAVQWAESTIASGVRHSISNATKQLVSHAFEVELDEATKSKVEVLHPESVRGLTTTQQPTEEEMPMEVTVDSKKLMLLCSRVVANGSAPGPSGWTGEHLAVVARDEECRPGLVAMVQAIINEELSEAAKPLLLSSRLVLVGKKNGGVRPIAMGETLFKAACMYVRCTIMGTSIAEAFNDGIQYGVAIRGGCDTAILKIQAGLDADHRNVAILADISNAYNTRERGDIADALHADRSMRPLWRLFRFAYGEASPLLVYGKKGKLEFVQPSCNGVRQGDPLSSVLFALSMREIYAKVSRVVVDGCGVSCVAVQDDLTIIGRPTAAAAAMDVFMAECKLSNLKVNRDKCVVCVPGNANPERSSIDAWAADRGIPLAPSRFVAVLGSAVGHDEAAMSAWAVAHVDKHARFFQLVPRLHKQSAMLVLRLAGVPKFNNVLRTLPPRIVSAAAAKFDERVESCFSAISGISSDEMTGEVRQQMQLPLLLGGAGMVSAVAVAPSAYLGAVAMAAPHLDSAFVAGRLRARELATDDVSTAQPPPPPPIPPPIYPPLPRDHLDAKHSAGSAASKVAAGAGSAAAAAGGRVRGSSLARLPAPRSMYESCTTVVEDAATCYDAIATEFRPDQFAAVKGFVSGAAFWRIHGRDVSSVSASSSGAHSARNSSDLRGGAGAAESASSSSSSSSFSAAAAAAAVAAAAVVFDGDDSEAEAVAAPRIEPEEHTVKLQRQIMAVIQKLQSVSLQAAVSQKASVRLAACRRNGASGWLSVHPLEEALRLSNGEMVSAMRHMFGLSPIATGWYCRCGASVGAGHFHSCNALHGPATNTRHETVVSELASFGLSHLQLHVERTPSIATADGALIDGAKHVVPDIVFRGASFQLAIDVSLVYSESASRLALPYASGKDAYSVVHSAMGVRARAKVRKYETACRRDGLEFDAFVLDSHGATDASAERVMTRLVSYGADVLGVDEVALRSYIRRRLAVAIQRGNARLDQQAVAMSRRGFGAAVAAGYAVPRSSLVGAAADQ